jgi:AmiR/NasT family two-component response regulator
MRIGRMLAETHGVTVLFTTTNPAQLGEGVPGTLGVLPKPLSGHELRAALAYAVARHEASEALPPRRLQLFEPRAPLYAP